MQVSFRFEFTESELKSHSHKNKTKNSEMSEENSDKPLIFSLATTESSWNREYTERLEFKDTPSELLETQLDKVILEMFITANRFRGKDELYHRELERRWAAEERERRLKELKRKEEENVKILERVVSDWDKARKIREFAESLEQSTIGAMSGE
jgi:hypothetical protein